ncbi:MAG: hypothetical protein HY901_25310 [Deltaproteobacteria bacterium]|nr:hypothetical protein [Deltaproteobacteria bacterium]
MNTAAHSIGHRLGARLAFLGLLASSALTPTAAGAATLVWLAPDRAPQGPFRVGLVGLDARGVARECAAKVSASGATIEELAVEGQVRTFSVHPASPSPSAVRLEAQQAEARAVATVELGPSGSRLELKAIPARPVKGQDVSVQLEIAVLGEGPSAPVLRSNVGSIEELKPLGGGRFSATYRLPRERYPEVAIVVAFAPWPHADASEGAFGALAIPLSSSVVLPGRSEARAQVAVEIAGRTFGPVPVDAQGGFEVPVVVPPGHRFGTAFTTDRLGNRRAKQVDLRLPPTDQIACVANPTSLPADGASKARVVCLATDPFGAPVSKAKVSAKAKLGRLAGPRPRGLAYEWEYTAPASVDAIADELAFDFPAGGTQSRERLEPRFRSLPVAHARLDISPQPVFVGSSASAALAATDRAGRPVGVQPRLAAQRGSLSPFESGDGGLLVARYQSPSQPGADLTDRIQGQVLAAPGSVPARLRFSAADGQGSRLLVRAEGIAGEPVEGLSLELLGAAPAITDANGVASFALPAIASAPHAVETFECSVSDRPALRARAFRYVSAQGLRLFPEEGPFEPLALERSVQLAPAVPVDVRLELTAKGLRASVLDVSGRTLKGRKISWSVTRAGGTPVALEAAREEPDGTVFVPFASPVAGPVSASVSDTESGVFAAEETVLP